jgi:ParB family transcriptional regulator, chromosome partitioning protein
MKKPITVSGLIGLGSVQESSPAKLAQFKGQADFSNSLAINISLSMIEPNPYQPRRIFPDSEINELAESIDEIGLIQPIAVRKIDEQLYQIIAGERRFRAYKQLNKTEIACVQFVCDDSDMAVMAIAENVNREDLSDYEIAKSIRNVENLFPTKKKLAEALGFQREDMYRYFAYDTLPAFLVEKLESNPRLVSRNAASEIKRVLTNTNPEQSEFALSALKEAIQLLENAEIDQTKIANYIIQKVKYAMGTVTANKEREEFYIEGKRIGYFSSSNNGVVIKISTGVLDADKTEKLKSILSEFIKNSTTV